MNSKFSLAFALSASLMMTSFVLPSFADDTTNPENGELRLENEVKLSVPGQISEDVWAFLQDDQSSLIDGLKKFGSDFSVKTAVEQFVDVYYDDPAFRLLGKQSGVRFRQRFTPNNPTSKKNGRRLVQIKVHLDNASESTRGEFKFVVPKEARLYSDLPPIGALIKRDEAPMFLQKLSDYGVDGRDLKPVMRVDQERRRIYISKGAEAFATITLDLVRSNRFWTEEKFTEIEIELNEVNYTNADESAKGGMERVMHAMTDAILKQFPGIVVNQTPKYNKMFTRISDRIPLFKFLLKLSWLA